MKNKYFYILLICIAFTSTVSRTMAQIGISVSPPRVYYTLDPGQSGTQKILVSNISKTNELNLAMTTGDWKYDEKGDNLMFPPDSLSNSCAGWLTVNGGSYITLKPGENREIELKMTVPADTKDKGNVHTAMFYVTQMNPVDGVDEKGAAIKINVRSGIKIYQKGNAPETKKLDIEKLSFYKGSRTLLLTFYNRGNVWTNGNASVSLLNKGNGKETKLGDTGFYTMPGDKRVMAIPLKKDLAKGAYTATVMLDYGDSNNIEAAELDFNYE